MAKSNKQNKNEDISFLDRIRKKDRLVVVDLDTYEEIRHFNFSALSIIIYSLFLAFIIVLITWLLIAFTPIRQTIPGYPNISQQKELSYKNKKNEEWLAAQQKKLNQEHIYYKNLHTILSDSIVKNTVKENADSTATEIQLQNFEISKRDSILRQKIDEKEKYLIKANNANQNHKNDLNGVLFFPPLNGTISDSLNTKIGHYGVDIIAPKDEPVKSTLNGTIIFADWTPDNGNVIHVQHAHNLISVYKHNAVLLKKVGDYVKTGEPIAIIGNSGKLSSGPHLHFELWHKGIVLNPVNYIIF